MSRAPPPPGHNLLNLLIGLAAGIALGASFGPRVLLSSIGLLVLGLLVRRDRRIIFTLAGLVCGLVRLWLPISAMGGETAVFSRAQIWAAERINAAVPYPASALASGVLFGRREDMPEQLTDEMRASGLSHMLAVSGYNVSIVAVVVAGLIKKVASKRVRTGVVLVAVGMYVLACGAGPPVVRAGLMGGVASLVLLSSRPTNARRALLAAVTLLLLWNPYLVRFDVGFQLSVAATAGLVLLGPALQQLSRALPNPLGMRDAALTSMAASLSTLPVVAATFGTIPLYGIPANIMAAPLVPISMLTGTLALAGGDSGLGRVAGTLCAFSADTLARIAHAAATLPGSQHAISLRASLVVVLVALAGLVVTRIALQKYKNRRAAAPLLS